MLVWILGALGLTGGGIGIAALLGGGPAMLMAAKWLLGWLKHATFLQVACIALALFAGIQTLRVSAEKRHSAKVEQQLARSIAELNRLTSAKNTQRTITKTNIVTVTKRIHDAEERAKIVETAPLPGNCKTPPEIMGADL
jgi:hypothetical protein